jgi:ADP-ribose pyrophosphatase YjhB (NUDIX family)
MSNGPAVRTDVVDVYVFRRRRAGLEFLQLRRATAPLRGTWQPVMGHVRRRETAERAMWRELREETGLGRAGGEVLDAFALEQVHPFFVRELDAIVLSPRFAVRVAGTWVPSLNGEHDSWRWVRAVQVARAFLWPGQRAAIRELSGLLKPERREALLALRLTGPRGRGS